MRGLSAGLACVICGLAFGTVQAEESSTTPSVPSAQAVEVMAEIDRLMLLQDATAQGKSDAVQQQKELLNTIGEHIASLPDGASPPRASSIIAYVMSGGDPRIAERLSKQAGFAPPEQRLLQASAQFMQGDRDAAEAVMAKLDPRRLPERIAGRVALSQALLAKDDMRQESYAVALSAMPGTLVEESALRRSALAYGDARDGSNFWRRLERYARRFPASVYATGFWSEAMSAVVRWAAKPPGPELHRLDSVLALRPLGERRRMYLTLARLAAGASNSGLTEFAARRLERLAEEGSAEQQLGIFYRTLYDIVSLDGDEALQRLRSLRRDLLGQQEQALLDAALALGAMIERPEPAVTAAGDDAVAEQTPQEQRGKSLLAASANLLTELN